MIRKLEEPHTCGTTNQSSRIDTTWIAKVFEEEIRSDPDWKIQGLIDEIQRRYGVEITKMMAYRARAKAGEVVLGNHKAQYKRIRDYCQTVIDKNPGSVVRVATINRVNEGLNPRFFGLFMCLKAQIDGFLNGCRPFIGQLINYMFPILFTSIYADVNKLHFYMQVLMDVLLSSQMVHKYWLLLLGMVTTTSSL